VNNFARAEFWKYVNTVLITLGLGISLWVLGQVAQFRKDQRKMQLSFLKEQKRIELEFAKANQVLIDHIDDSDMWIGVIQDLADQKHPATKSRYTKLDAVRDKDILRKEVYQYLEKYYQKKP